MPSPTNITLNESQKNALKLMKDFVGSLSDRCFLLTGYAGTGKTTLMRFFIDHLAEKGIRYVLLSTTGRAAKILSNHTGRNAKTVHSLIYAYKGLNQDLSEIEEETIQVDHIGQLYINFEATSLNGIDIDPEEQIVYIVDEASMMSDIAVDNPVQAKFGSGKLLTDLFNYDRRRKAKYVFVGDPCQLPPIVGNTSPALDENHIARRFSYGVKSVTLTQVMRQDNGNSIVLAAEKVRQLWKNAPLDTKEYYKNQVWGILPIAQFPDVHFYGDINEMLEQYLDCIKQHGYNEAVVICQSNKDTNLVSQYIRERLNLQGILQKGDLLMVQQNQYTTGLMNGDMVEVVSIGSTASKTLWFTHPKGYRSQLLFREIIVKELFTQKQFTTLIIETPLASGQNNLDEYQQTALFLDFVLRMKQKGITQKKNNSLFYDCMTRDPFLNALRCSYGYAVTCHKAQGGEWNKVFVQFSRRNITLNPTKEIYQWIYTAITRAKQNVSFIKEFYFR